MKYLALISRADVKTAMCFDTHDDAVDYINECIDYGGQKIRSVQKVGNDKFEIKIDDNMLFTVTILAQDDGDVRFDLEYSGIKGGETRRFSRRYLAINFITKILDEKYNCLAEPGENEMGEWVMKNYDKNPIGSAKLWLVILSEQQNTDDYATLGLKTIASKSEVKTAYRKLSFETHPDKGGDAFEFEKIHNAYQRIMEGHGRKANRRVLRKYLCSDMRYFFKNLVKEMAKAKSINDAQLQIIYAQVRSKAASLIIRGIIEMLIGGALTGASYGAASSSSHGEYTIFTGLLVVGGWNILRGIYYCINPKALLAKVKK